MKSSIVLLVVAAILTPGLTHAQCAKLTITGHPEYPPVAWKDGDRIAGAGAAAVSKIATDLGLVVESKYVGSWADAQAAARNGAIDVIFGIYFNF
jgi:polar amino acid transport system substrate-binding protein